MHILFNILFLIAGIKWGDWKHWRDYYPTYLFFIGGDLFFNAILHDYRFWNYKESYWFENLLFGHLIIDILIMIVAYSSTILIYLGKFPHGRVKQFLWVLLWIGLYSLVEFINSAYLDLFEYHHGWNIYWSILFNFVMFPVLKIHVKRPLLAWIISILYFIFLYNFFDVPKKSFY